MSEAKVVLSAVDQTRAAFEAASKNLTGLHTKAVAVSGAIAGLGVTAYVAKLAADVGQAIEEWDELGKAAQRAGFQSAEGIAEFQFAAKLAGIDAGGFEGAVSKLNGKMADAAGGSKEAAALFQAMGIKVKDASGNLRNTEDVLTDLAEKFASYEEGPEKAALAAELFGEKAGRRLIPLLNGGADGLAKVREEFRKLHGEISPELIKQSEQFNDNMTRLEAAMGGLSRTIAQKTVGALAQITDAMVEQAKKGGSLLTVWAGIKETFNVFAGKNEAKGKEAQLALLEESLRVGGDSPDGKLAARIQALRDEVGQKKIASTVSTGDFARLDRQAPLSKAPVIQKQGSSGEDEGASILKRIKERIAAQTAEVAAGRKLTEQEQFEAKVNADLANSKHTINAATRAQIASQLTLSASTARTLEARTRQQAMNKAIVEEQQQTQDEMMASEAQDSVRRGQFRLAIDEQTSALEDSTKMLELEARLIGSTDRERTVAIEHLRIEQQLRKDLDALDRNTSFDEPQRQDERARLTANADRAKQLATGRGDLDERTTLFGNMESAGHEAFLNLGEDGESAAKRIGRAFKTNVLELLYQMTAKRWLIQLSAQFGGGGGGGAMGGLGGLGSLFGSSAQAYFSQTSLGSSGFGTGLSYGNMDMGAFLHAGGIAGAEHTFTRPVDPSVFVRAPRFHTGGVAGDEVPAVLKRGEGVFTPGQMKALGGGSDSKITIINNTRSPIGKVTEQRISSEERALIIEEASDHFAARLGDASSRQSKAVSSHYNVQRRR